MPRLEEMFDVELSLTPHDEKDCRDAACTVHRRPDLACPEPDEVGRLTKELKSIEWALQHLVPVCDGLGAVPRLAGYHEQACRLRKDLELERGVRLAQRHDRLTPYYGG